MLFNSPKTVILLKRNSLEVYSKNQEAVESRLDFPPNYENDQEILDLEKFEQLIANFLTKLNLQNKKVIIAISTEDLFEKTIPLTDDKKEKAETKKFFDSIPFDLQKVAKLEIRTKNGINLIATNHNLYETIVHTLQRTQAEIEAVVPISMFGITTSTLTKQDLSRITSNSEMLKNANFLSKTYEKPEEQIEESLDSTKTPPEKFSKPASKKNPVLIGGVVFILIGLAIIAYLLLRPKSPPQNIIEDLSQKEPVTSQTQEETESTSSSSAEETSKDEIRIQVLNGSGVSGQASRVRNLLANINYSQIDIGNADSQDFKKTTVRLSSNISEELKAELQSELETLFESVEFEADLDSENFDIVITTGQPS